VLDLIDEPSRDPMTSSCWTMPACRVEGRSLLEGDQVAAVLRVDEHHALANRERSLGHVLSRLVDVPAFAARRSMNRKSTIARAMDSHFEDRCAQARPNVAATATRKMRRST